MKIAVLKTKKFELTESIEMFHLNRIRAAQENNKKQNEEKSFLELGEGCTFEHFLVEIDSVHLVYHLRKKSYVLHILRNI